MKSLSSPDGSYTLLPPDKLLPLNRHLSYRLTPLIYKLPLSPNHVTTLSILAGLAAAYNFSIGEKNWGILGALFFILCYTLDNCDGEIARLKDLSSEFGARFDDMADWLVDTAFFIGLGYGTWQASTEIFWLWLGLTASIGATIDYAVDSVTYAREKNKPHASTPEEVATNTRKPRDIGDWFIYIFHKLSRADFSIIVFSLAIFDITWILLPLAAVGAQAYWITDLFQKARGWHT